MNWLRVTHSPIRQVLVAVAGLVLVLAAIEIVWLHQLSGPPPINDDGALAPEGIVARRTDIVWGALFLFGGLAGFIGSVAGLVVRKPVVELTDDGLWLRVGRTPRAKSSGVATCLPWLEGVAVPWSEVLSVRSTTDESEDWQPTRILVVEVTDPSVFPVGLWGGERVGSKLHLDADGWEIPPEEVAMRAELVIRYHERISHVDHLSTC